MLQAGWGVGHQGNIISKQQYGHKGVQQLWFINVIAFVGPQAHQCRVQRRTGWRDTPASLAVQQKASVKPALH